MNREFLFEYGREEERWSFSDSLSRWSWGVMCCGAPGIPCSYCSCCRKTNEEEPSTIIINDTETLPIQTCERELPQRPHALRGRKSTPELMSAVKYALTQLQGQPVPQTPDLKKAHEKDAPENEAPEKEAPEIEAPQKDASEIEANERETPEKNASEKDASEKQDSIKKGETG